MNIRLKNYKPLKEEMDLDRTWADTFGDKSEELALKQLFFASPGKAMKKLFGMDFPFDYRKEDGKIVIDAEGYNDDGTLFDMKDVHKEKIIRTFRDKIPSANAKPNMGGGITVHLEESVNEVGFDANDPVLMKARAAAEKKKQKQEPRINPDYKALKNAPKIKALEKQRAQLMRDMEQEAEPEGGPIADRYGRALDKIDAKIAKLKESVNEAKYRVEYTTQDGEKAKSRVYSSKEEADKKEADLVNSGIKQAKVVKVEESVNEVDRYSGFNRNPEDPDSVPFEPKGSVAQFKEDLRALFGKFKGDLKNPEFIKGVAEIMVNWKSLLRSQLDEVKVDYDFSERELVRVLRKLLRGASGERGMIQAFKKALGRDITDDELFGESVNEEDKKWSSYEQRMVNQIKAAQREGRGMYTLPMKTQDFWRKHRDKFELKESVNEEVTQKQIDDIENSGNIDIAYKKAMTLLKSLMNKSVSFSDIRESFEFPMEFKLEKDINYDSWGVHEDKLYKGTFVKDKIISDHKKAVYVNHEGKQEVTLDQDDIRNLERLGVTLNESNWENKLKKKAVWVDDDLIRKFKETLGKDQWRYFIRTLDKAEKGLDLDQTEEQVVKYFTMVKANWDDAIAKGMSPDEITLNPNKPVDEGTCGYDTNVKTGKKNKVPGGKKGLEEKIKSIIKNIQ